MSNITDALDAVRKQQKELNNFFSSPAFEALKESQKQLASIRFFDFNNEYNNMLKRVNYSAAITQLKLDFSHVFQENSALMETLKSLSNIKIDLPKDIHFPDYSHLAKDIFQKTTVFHGDIFKDITFDSLSVFNEVLAEESVINDTSVVNKSNLVGNITKDELRAEIVEAIKSAQEEVNKETTLKEQFRVFIGAVIVGVGVDFAKDILINIVFPILLSLAANNHDYIVAQQISEKISQNETGNSVKKAFLKNPEVDKPVGEMAFLRTETHLRNRPQKQSHLASAEPVSQNTVVFPIERKGNWILVEVETKTDAFIGWIEESKLVKFKLK
jgi:hypothetical protein